MRVDRILENDTGEGVQQVQCLAELKTLFDLNLTDMCWG